MYIYFKAFWYSSAMVRFKYTLLSGNVILLVCPYLDLQNNTKLFYKVVLSVYSLSSSL